MLLVFPALLYGQWFSNAAKSLGANRFYWAAVGITIWLGTLIIFSLTADALVWPLLGFETDAFHYNYETLLQNVILGSLLGVIPATWVHWTWLQSPEALSSVASEIGVTASNKVQSQANDPPGPLLRKLHEGFVASAIVTVATLVQAASLMAQNPQWTNQPLVLTEFCVALGLTLGAFKRSRAAFVLILVLYSASLAYRYIELGQVAVAVGGTIFLFWFLRGLYASIQYAKFAQGDA